MENSIKPKNLDTVTDLNSSQIASSFFDNLRKADGSLLLLDYDGTLAPFVEDRHKAFPAPGVKEAIQNILSSSSRHRVVIVTGREANDALKLLGLTDSIEVWGCHGREYRSPTGEISHFGITEKNQEGLSKGKELAEPLVPEGRLETKAGCVTVHWRGLPEQAQHDIHETVSKAWEEILSEHELEIVEFNGGLELHVPSRSKGDAIEALLKSLKTNDIPVAFLGDDRTDENGFRALKGKGLSVFVEVQPRETLADIAIKPEGVVQFLDTWNTAIQRKNNV